MGIKTEEVINIKQTLISINTDIEDINTRINNLEEKLDAHIGGNVSNSLSSSESPSISPSESPSVSKSESPSISKSESSSMSPSASKSISKSESLSISPSASISPSSGLCSYSDDFTKPDGNTADSNLWTKTNTGFGDAIIWSNELSFTGGGVGGITTLNSRWMVDLSNVFEITIDFNRFGSTEAMSFYLGLLGVDSGIHARVGIETLSSARWYSAWETGEVNNDFTASVTAGKFRLRSDGTNITAWAWSGSQWEWDGSTAGFTFANEVDGRYQVTIERRFGDAFATCVSVDNFTVVTGCENIEDGSSSASPSLSPSASGSPSPSPSVGQPEDSLVPVLEVSSVNTEVGEEVYMSASGTTYQDEDILKKARYEWDFGDGYTYKFGSGIVGDPNYSDCYKGLVVTHYYMHPGDFTVTLTATIWAEWTSAGNPIGDPLEVKTISKTISVNGEAPVAGFEIQRAPFHNRLAQYLYVQVPEAYNNAQTTLRVSLEGPDGVAVLLDKNNPGIEENLLLDHKLLGEGDYCVIAQLIDPDGNQIPGGIWRDKFSKKYSGIPKVGIDENNAFRLNGELFFPISPFMTDDGSIGKFVDKAKINNLNTEGYYPTHNPESWETYLNLAKSYGLSAIGPGRGDYNPGLRWHFNHDVERIKEYVLLNKDNDAMFAWAWQDEPNLGGRAQKIYLPTLAGWAYVCHEIDPQHPTANLYAGGDWSRYYKRTTPTVYDYLGSADLFGGKKWIQDFIGFDMYTIAFRLTAHLNFEDMGPCSAYLDVFDRLTSNNKDLVPVLPCINPGHRRPENPAPTAEQIFYEAWSNVIHGAKGIIWFPYFMPETIHWDSMLKFANQMEVLAPVVLQAVPDRTVSCDATESLNRVDTMIREYENNIYVISARVTEPEWIEGAKYLGVEPETVTATFKISGLVGTHNVEVVDEDRVITSVDGEFTDVFNKCDVHIYKVSYASPNISVRPSWQEIKNYVEGDTIDNGEVLVLDGVYASEETITFPADRKITVSGDVTIDLIKPAFLVRGGGRLTGVTFNTSVNLSALETFGLDWRVDHCKYNNTAYDKQGIFVYSPGGFINGDPCRGLIDNNRVISGKILPTGYGNPVAHENESKMWLEPTGLGKYNTVYIEDNQFSIGPWDSPINDAGNCVDTNYGGSYVFRYNEVRQAYVEAHSYQKCDSRGTRRWEIYGNKITSYGNLSWVGCSIRGGTGVIWGNDFTPAGSPYNFDINFDNVRSVSDIGSFCGKCNGESIVDGNIDINGWPCRDQIGRGQDEFLWKYWEEGSPIPNQASEPVYCWLNRDTGNIVSVNVKLDFQPYIQPNRDYFNEVDNFDGSVGVGVGLKSDILSGVNFGVAYWATEEQTLYKYTENGWEVFYTPYIYPHPLRT